MQNEQDFSQQFLNSIKTIDNIPCYVKINNSKFIVIAIHEHLGLVEGFAEMISEFVRDNASIIIPDIFCNIQAQKIDQDDEFSCLKQINFNDARLILKKCIQYVGNKNKYIILLGFSIGAALGLKLIEQFNNVSLGAFFYGLPLTKTLQPSKINCPVIIFHAEKDKVRYLSDDQQLKKVLSVYANIPHIQLQKISSSHGFMNHQHSNYDQKSFKYCQKILQKYFKEIQIGQGKIRKEEALSFGKKQQEQSGCLTF